MAPTKVRLAFGGENLWKPSVKPWTNEFQIPPNALSVLFEMAREINKLKTEDAEKANGTCCAFT